MAHLEEEMEVLRDLRGREGAPERGLEVPDGRGGGERHGGGPPVEGSDLELPLRLCHWGATGVTSPPRVVRGRGSPAGGFWRAPRGTVAAVCRLLVSLSSVTQWLSVRQETETLDLRANLTERTYGLPIPFPDWLNPSHHL
jgi:hypothetical protein